MVEARVKDPKPDDIIMIKRKDGDQQVTGKRKDEEELIQKLLKMEKENDNT